MRQALLCWICLAISACALPDYKVEDSAASSELSLSGAPDACAACSAEHCSTERTSCGDSCSDFSWPVSPAWSVDDTATAYVECLASQCEADCQVQWGCVGNYSFPTPKDEYTVTVTAVDALSSQPLPDVVVYACQGVDPSCSGAGRVARSVSDATGQVKLQLPAAFVGYFLADPSAVISSLDYLPSIVKPSQPFYRVTQALDLIVVPRDLAAAVGQQLQLSLDSNAGYAVFRALNCMPAHYVQAYDGSGAPLLGFAATINALASASGVTVEYQSQSASDAKIYYLDQSLSVNLNASATQQGGLAGVYNLPLGQTSITGRNDTQQVSSTSMTVALDSVGLVLLAPDTDH